MKSATDEPRDEYDFRDGVRGKHVGPVAAESNIVVLDPDVAEAFPESAAMNAALRSVLAAAVERREAE